MVFIKPPEDWSDKTSDYYDGPPPPPAIYNCTVNGMWRKTVGEGATNAGADMLMVSVKVADGKYKGATVLTTLLMAETSAWKLNQFLVSLTDGTEEQVAGIKRAAYKTGFNLSDGDPEKLGMRVLSIGKKFLVDGKPLLVKIGEEPYEGQMRATVDRFVAPLAGDDDDDDDDSGDDDGIGDFEPETTSTPTESKPEPEPETSGPPAEDDDADDPWS